MQSNSIALRSVPRQRHLHVFDFVDRLAVSEDLAVGDAHREPARLHGLGEVDLRVCAQE